MGDPTAQALRREQPIIAGMFHQPSAGLRQPVRQTRQRPVPNERGAYVQPAPDQDIVKGSFNINGHLEVRNTFSAD